MFNLKALENSLFSKKPEPPAEEKLLGWFGELQLKIQKSPDDPSLYRFFVEVCRLLGRSEEAVSILTEVLTDQVDDRGDFHAYLAQSLAHCRLFADAVRPMEVALEKNPDHLGRLYTLSFLKARVGDQTGAAEALERLLAVESKTGVKFEKRALLSELANGLWGLLDHQAFAWLEDCLEAEIEQANKHVFRQGAIEHFYDDGLEVEWCPTYRCNYKCSYCFFRVTPSPGWDDLKKTADALIALDRSAYNIAFFGGEPTTHPDLAELVQYLHAHLSPRLSLSITTNGYRGAKYFDDLFSPLLKKDPRAHFMVMMSIHTEHARLKDVLAVARQMPPQVLLHFSLMFNPEKREYVKEIWSALCQLRADRYFSLEVKPLLGSPEFVAFDKRYTESDLAWIPESTEKFRQLAAESAAKPPQVRPRKSGTLFFDMIHQDQRKMIYHPFTEFEENSFDIPWNGRFNFKGMWCVMGATNLGIHPDGTCYGTLCQVASNTRTPNLVRDQVFQNGIFPFVVQCNLEVCKWYICHSNPKFSDRREAETFVETFKKKWGK